MIISSSVTQPLKKLLHGHVFPINGGVCSWVFLFKCQHRCLNRLFLNQSWVKNFLATGVVLMVFVLGIPSAHCETDNMYRYKDKNGKLVIRDSIPPEYVSGGYDIVDEFGRLLSRVDKSLTEEEKLKKRKNDELLKLQEQKRAEQEQRDLRLLKNYTEPADVDKALARKLETIDRSINRTKGDISRLNIERIENLEAAADYNRNGQKAPENITKAISRLDQDIARNEALIKAKEIERVKIVEQFKADKERLSELAGESAKGKLAEDAKDNALPANGNPGSPPKNKETDVVRLEQLYRTVEMLERDLTTYERLDMKARQEEVRDRLRALRAEIKGIESRD